MDNITQDILNVKIETAKESTLLIVKDILISSKKRQDVTLERIDEIKRLLSEDRSSKYVETKEVLEKRSKELERHLNYSKCLFDKVNPVDEKSLRCTYIPYNAIVTSTDTWTYEDRYFSDNKSQWEEWKIEDFLLDGPWYSVVGAPFGIGKTRANASTLLLAEIFPTKTVDIICPLGSL